MCEVEDLEGRVREWGGLQGQIYKSTIMMWDFIYISLRDFEKSEQ